MKLEQVHFYQAIPVGAKRENWFNTLSPKFKGLIITFENGLIRAEGPMFDKPRLIPTANVMYMVPMLDEKLVARQGAKSSPKELQA